MSEPEAVVKLRVESQGRYDLEELSVQEGREIVAYIDAIVAERDAAVRERDAFFDDWKCAVGLLDEARDVAHENTERAERAEAELHTLRARLAACERVVEAACAESDDPDGVNPHALYQSILAYRAAVATAQGEA